MLIRNFLSLYAPSGLHTGFLTILRVWVQTSVYSDSTCSFSTGGVSCGVSCEVPFLDGVWVTGLIGISKCGTTCPPPGSLMYWCRRPVCLGVYLLLPRCLVRVEGYGGMVGGLGPGLDPVLLLGLSDKAPPGRAASGKTVFLPVLERLQFDAPST